MGMDNPAVAVAVKELNAKRMLREGKKQLQDTRMAQNLSKH